MKNSVHTHLNLFRRNEDGVTAIEYGVIMALLSGVLLIALPNITSGISNPLGELTTAINNGGGASSGDDGEGEGESDDGESDGESEHASSGHGDDDHESDDDHGDDDHGDDDHEDS
jgi:Flp pilus assembly pilin Flp